MSEENTLVLAALLNLEPTGGLEPPAFSLPKKCWTTISQLALA
jgi:hypothetical protein